MEFEERKYSKSEGAPYTASCQYGCTKKGSCRLYPGKYFSTAHLMLSDILDFANMLNICLNCIPYIFLYWKLTKAYFSLEAALYRIWWIKSLRTIGHGVSTCVVNKIIGKLPCCLPKL